MDKLEAALLLLFPLSVFLLSFSYYPVEPSETEVLAINASELPPSPQYVRSVIAASKYEGTGAKSGKVVEVRKRDGMSMIVIEDGGRTRAFLPPFVKEPEKLVGSNVTIYGPVIKTKRGEVVIVRALVVGEDHIEARCIAKEMAEKKCDELLKRHKRPSGR